MTVNEEQPGERRTESTDGGRPQEDEGLVAAQGWGQASTAAGRRGK